MASSQNNHSVVIQTLTSRVSDPESRAAELVRQHVIDGPFSEGRKEEASSALPISLSPLLVSQVFSRPGHYWGRLPFLPSIFAIVTTDCPRKKNIFVLSRYPYPLQLVVFESLLTPTPITRYELSQNFTAVYSNYIQFRIILIG